MKNDPTPLDPEWFHSLGDEIQRDVFAYELARRTPAGRARGWPRWDEVNPHVRAAMCLGTLRPWTKSPIAFEKTNGYHALTNNYYQQKDHVYFDLSKPIDELAEYFKQIVLNLRAEHKIVEAPRPPRETQDIPWRWLEIIDTERVLNDSERSIKSKALAKGQSHVEVIARCFDTPTEVLWELALRRKTNG